MHVVMDFAAPVMVAAWELEEDWERDVIVTKVDNKNKKY